MQLAAVVLAETSTLPQGRRQRRLQRRQILLVQGAAVVVRQGPTLGQESTLQQARRDWLAAAAVAAAGLGGGRVGVQGTERARLRGRRHSPS